MKLLDETMCQIRRLARGGKIEPEESRLDALKQRLHELDSELRDVAEAVVKLAQAQEPAA